MRNLWLGVLLAGMAGCSTQTLNFEHQSELQVSTRGVALQADGQDAVAGMFGTTCRVSVADGQLGDDYDIPGTDLEMVQDAGDVLGNSAVVVVSDLGAHVTYPDRFWDWQPDHIAGPGILEGRIYGDGFALLDEGEDCQVSWVGGNDAIATHLGGALCDRPSFTVNRDTGDAYVANGDSVVVAGTDGAVEEIAQDADLVVWDAAAEVLYAAMIGGSTVRGIETDGHVRWTADVPGEIVAMDDMGPLAQAAVMVGEEDSTGSLILLDGFTGELSSSMATPQPANEITTSADGGTMAMVLDREVHFFNVHATP